MSDSKLIIERPDLQTLAQRFGSMTLTFGFWVLYLYLWLPGISALAWLVEGGLFYEHMIERRGYVAIGRVLGAYLSVIGITSGLFLAWARLNQFRFRGEERRARVATVSAFELGRSFGVPPRIVHAWQQSRRVVVHFDDEGRIVPSPQVLARLAQAAAMRSAEADG